MANILVEVGCLKTENLGYGYMEIVLLKDWILTNIKIQDKVFF